MSGRLDGYIYEWICIASLAYSLCVAGVNE